MKSYEEIAASVFERRDAHEAQRKKRMALIGKCSTIGAGFCCIALIALGFFKGELSDVQDFREYVGNTTEATTETQDDSSENESMGSSQNTDVPLADGDATDGTIHTGVMVDDAYLNEDYIYIIQDPTEPPEEQSSETTEQATGESETQTQTGTTGSSATDVTESTRPGSTSGGNNEIVQDPTESVTSEPVTEMETIQPTSEDVQYPVTTRPNTTTTQVITSISFVTSISEVTMPPTESPTKPGESYVPPRIYDNLKLSSSDIEYDVSVAEISASEIGNRIESGVIIYSDDGSSYVKVDVYLIKGTDSNLSVAVKYQGDLTYYIAYNTTDY